MERESKREVDEVPSGMVMREGKRVQDWKQVSSRSLSQQSSEDMNVPSIARVNVVCSRRLKFRRLVMGYRASFKFAPEW